MNTEYILVYIHANYCLITSLISESAVDWTSVGLIAFPAWGDRWCTSKPCNRLSRRVQGCSFAYSRHENCNASWPSFPDQGGPFSSLTRSSTTQFSSSPAARSESIEWQNTCRTCRMCKSSCFDHLGEAPENASPLIQSIYTPQKSFILLKPFRLCCPNSKSIQASVVFVMNLWVCRKVVIP